MCAFHPADGADDGGNLAVNYLDFVVRRGKHRNPAIYNYLLSLLAEQVCTSCTATLPFPLFFHFGFFSETGYRVD
jgi:hypothetical protein